MGRRRQRRTTVRRTGWDSAVTPGKGNGMRGQKLRRRFVALRVLGILAMIVSWPAFSSNVYAAPISGTTKVVVRSQDSGSGSEGGDAGDVDTGTGTGGTGGDGAAGGDGGAGTGGDA